jgi:hypothetical protein
VSSEEIVEILEPWHEVSLSSVSARTQMGQAIKLGLTHGWMVKVARTVSKIHERERKNGNIVEAKTEEHFWVGGTKPSFDSPQKTFLINKIYIKKNMEPCDFPALKKFIMEN